MIVFAGVVVFAIFLPDIVTSIPKPLVGQERFLVLLLAIDMAVSIPMDTLEERFRPSSDSTCRTTA